MAIWLRVWIQHQWFHAVVYNVAHVRKSCRLVCPGCSLHVLHKMLVLFIGFLMPSINKISEAKFRQEPACFVMPLGATVQHVYVSGTYWGTSSPPVICPLVGAAHVLMAFALQLGYKAWVMSIEP